MNSETMKERMSITQMKEFEQMMFQAEGVTQDDIDRYYKIQSAYKDFTDKEYEKSLGRGTDLKGIKFSECMEQYHKDQRRSRYSAKSTKTERGSQEYFMNTMGDRDIALIDKKLGMEYINHLEKDYNNKQVNTLSKATLRKKVGAVRSVLKWDEEQHDYNFLINQSKNYRIHEDKIVFTSSLEDQEFHYKVIDESIKDINLNIKKDLIDLIKNKLAIKESILINQMSLPP